MLPLWVHDAEYLSLTLKTCCQSPQTIISESLIEEHALGTLQEHTSKHLEGQTSGYSVHFYSCRIVEGLVLWMSL